MPAGRNDRYCSMKILTMQYLAGGLACLLTVVVVVVLNMVPLTTQPDEIQQQHPAPTPRILYEPDIVTTATSYDKIILITQPRDGTRDVTLSARSRDTLRSTWLRSLKAGDGAFFVNTVTDPLDREFRERLVDEAVTNKDMVVVEPAPGGANMSDTMVAVEWARGRFQYNVMLTVDDMTLVNTRELDALITHIGQYNATGTSTFSDVQHIHVWSSGTVLAFNKDHGTATQRAQLGGVIRDHVHGIRDLVTDRGLVTTQLEGFYPHWRGYCRAVHSSVDYDVPWVVVRGLDPDAMTSAWSLFSKGKDLCDNGSPRQGNKRLLTEQRREDQKIKIARNEM